AVLSMLMTTSTSYLLLASLDAARRQLAMRGRDLLEQAIELASGARKRIDAIPGLTCFGEELLQTSATFGLDPLKLTVRVADVGMTGYDAEVYLRERHNIEVELSDLYNILCIVSIGDTEEELAQLVGALTDLARGHAPERGAAPRRTVLPSTPRLAMPPRDAFYAPFEVVPLRAAVGRTIADMVMVYPPGIPVVLPGEVVTADNVEYIEANLAAGLPVQGPDDPTIRTVRVVREGEETIVR
ncbi:MAG: arginine decarboxylase, partial [Firmicutes bacterium]|nr:arginine decarboxylase [Bacillota bacterium]